MKKRVISVGLILCLCLSMISLCAIQASAFSPDNFKAQIKKITIGKPLTNADTGKKYLPVTVEIFAADNLSDSDAVHFLEGHLSALLKDGRTSESIRSLGMTLMGPVKPDVELDSNMWNWSWTPYDTGGGQGLIKYNVPLLENDETQTVEQSQATGLTEVNGLKVGDQITIQNETVVNTSSFPEDVVKELFPDGPSVFSNKATFTVEEESNYPKTIEVGEEAQTEVSAKAGKTKLFVGESTKVTPEVKNPVGETTFTSSNSKVATVDKNGKVKGVKSGTAYVRVTNNGKYTEMKFTVVKRSNPVTVKGKILKVKAKSKKTVFKKAKAYSIKNAKGKLVFKKVKGSKKITVNKKTGKITVKKGLKKGKTYKLKVKVSAKGNTAYKSKSKTVTVKIKVK